MTRFVYIPALSTISVYDLSSGSLKTDEPDSELDITLPNGKKRHVRVWSAEALLEDIEQYAAEGIVIRSADFLFRGVKI